MEEITGTIIGIIAAIITIIGMSLQLRKMLRTNDTTAISYNLSIFFMIGMGMWLFYGVYLNNFIIILPNAIGVLIMGIILGVKYANEN